MCMYVHAPAVLCIFDIRSTGRHLGSPDNYTGIMHMHMHVRLLIIINFYVVMHA